MSMATPITNHELFIRTNTPKRPSGPLKLNANVVARLNVDTSDDRDLSRVRKQLQESKSAAEKEKTERKIVVLPVPPPVVKPTASRSAPKVQKKKQPAKATIARAGPSRGISPFPGASVTQPVIQSVPAPSPQPSTSAAAFAVDAIANAPIIDDLTSLRGKLVHFLALGSQSGKDLAAELRGDMDKETFTEQLLSALNELAEKDMLPKNSNGATVTWRLKPSSWLAVRPHTYPLYNDSQRLTAERNARTFVSRLGIKEGDPQWEHVKFRGSGGGSSAVASASTTKKTGKSKAAATEIKAKSEAVMPSTSHRGKANTDSSTTSARPLPTSTPKPSQLNPAVSSRNPPPSAPAPILPERDQRERERAKRDLDPEREEGEISASATPPREPPAKSSVAPVNRRLPGSRLGSAAPHSSNSATNGVNRNGVGGTLTSLGASRDREAYAQSDRESERDRPLAVTTKKDSAVAAAKKQDRPPSALSNSSVKQERAPSVAQSVKTDKVERDRERDRAPGGSKHIESDRERDRDRERAREKERDHERELRMREAAREREREKGRGREQERPRPPKGTKRKKEPTPTWTEDESDEDDLASVSMNYAARKTARGESSVSDMTKKARASDAVAASGSGSGRNASSTVANAKLREEVGRERVREREHVKRDRRAWSRERGRDRDESERERDRDRNRDRVRERDRGRAERDQELHERDRRHRAESPVRKMIKREEPPSPASHRRTGSTTNVPKTNGTSGKAIERQSATASKREIKPSATKEGGSSRALDRERERERERERGRDREPPKRKERLGSEARKRLAEYTSTEDEGDLPPPSKSTKKSSGTTATAVRSRAHAPAPSATATSPSVSSSATSPRTLPSDSASLRSLYSATYAKFMKVFQELVSQKAKVKSLLGRGKIPNGLSNGRHGNGSSDSGDEDIELSDADIMGFEEMERLVKEHDRLREELDSIKSAFVG